MSEEEEVSTYFEIYKEPLPKELPPKTISFIINPTLNDIWTRLGYRDPEKASETNKLDIALTEAYLKFMADTVNKFDETIHNIHDHKKEFQRLKKIYGDKNSKLEVSDHLTLIEQENLTNQAIEKLHKKYAPRLELLKTLCSKCKKHFDKLGIEEDARGDYNELGDTDYSQERVEGFKQTLASLKKEESNRFNTYMSCEKSIRSISKELDEPLSDQVTFVLANELVDTDSLTVLTQASEDLTALKMQRYKELDELIEKVQLLYRILMIQPEDQLEIFRSTDGSRKPITPTLKVLDSLKSELKQLQAVKNENRKALIDRFQEEIDQICDKMRVPEKLRPRYVGLNLDEKLDFMEATASSMRDRLAKTGPIIEILSQIEEVKNKKFPKSSDTNNPNISQRLIDQHMQKQIDSELRPLEKELLQLLLQFRKENGFDFQFEGVTYIDTLSQTYLADDSEKFGTTVLDRRTPVSQKTKMPTTSQRATSYLTTNKSPKKYVSKKSPYTPKNRRKPLFEE